jgi:hypothetical protein
VQVFGGETNAIHVGHEQCLTAQVGPFQGHKPTIAGGQGHAFKVLYAMAGQKIEQGHVGARLIAVGHDLVDRDIVPTGHITGEPDQRVKGHTSHLGRAVVVVASITGVKRFRLVAGDALVHLCCVPGQHAPRIVKSGRHWRQVPGASSGDHNHDGCSQQAEKPQDRQKA